MYLPKIIIGCKCVGECVCVFVVFYDNSKVHTIMSQGYKFVCNQILQNQSKLDIRQNQTIYGTPPEDGYTIIIPLSFDP